MLQNGAEPAGTIPQRVPFEQPISIAQWEDAEVHFDFVDQAYAAVPIPVGAAFQLVARRNYFDANPAPLSVLATITNAAGGEDCGYFPINSSTTGAMEVEAEYPYAIVYTDENGKRWQVLPQSELQIDEPIATPGTPVVPGTSQPPLGLSTVTFRYVVGQPLDGSDITITIPVAARFPGAYGVSMTIGSDVQSTGYTIPIADRAADALRVVTAGELPDGTILEFTLSAVVP